MSTTASQAVDKRPVRWQADLTLAIVALIWGVTFVTVKRALIEISTMYFLAVRFGVASLFMLLIFGLRFRGAGSEAIWRGLGGGVAAGVFLWVGYALQTFGLKYTSAGNSGFLTGLYIVLVPLISAGIYRRLPRTSELVGIAIATVGMALLTMPSRDNLHINRGDLFTIGCAVAFAFQILVLGYYSQRERFEAVALGQIVCAAVLSTMSLAIEPPKAVWSNSVIFAVILTSLFATALAFALQTWAQHYTTPTRTALIFALEPVFALITAVSVGGERLTLAAACGGTLILAGIVAVELKPARKD